MIISCPECATQYNIPDDKITPAGRTLKCKKCEHQWHFTPEDTAKPAEPKEETPAIAAQKTSPSKPKIEPKKRNWMMRFATFLLIFSVISLCFIYFSPGTVSNIFPKTTAYYQSIGKLPKIEKPKKLAFQATDLQFNVNSRLFEVHTTLKNLTTNIVKLPMKLQIIGLDKENSPIQNWHFELADSYMEPSTEMALSYQLKNMKNTVDQIELKLQQM